MSTTDTAWQLQSAADSMAAALTSQEPAPTGADLTWQQEQARGAYEDAAHLTNQPKGW
ncbi:hypothetical protein [Streptomyces sp. NPDC020917]|uniref:hypothetical protein n=1 Tax=Streptomyces sp. NPDC020917 TaxID=3365102 RepID=UPI0037A18E46